MSPPAPGALRVRWLGRVHYSDAVALQRGLHARSGERHLLLVEHPPVYTLGVRAWRDRRHVLVDPAALGAPLVEADRGGDVTYHGPGQLVAYPIVDVPVRPGATRAYVHAVEQVVIDALADLGLPGAGRLDAHPGVWVGGRKICAIGVRLARGRSMHGFALNVDTDLARFEPIVACGIAGRGVTSLAAEGVEVTMAEVVEAVARRGMQRWGAGVAVDRQDAGPPAPPSGELGAELVARATNSGTGTPGSTGTPASRGTPVALTERKPAWLRAPARMGGDYRRLKATMRSLDLVTVCEEAGCPNIYECWGAGTATFMINGDRCTRACGFCLVDTRRPAPLDAGEPERVAEAVAAMGLTHAVVTAVARDDTPDGGAAAFAATIGAIRGRCPGTAVEVLIPDCKGEPGALATIFGARPDVVNHNLETVLRLQRAVRPSASYARSLAVLARAKDAGLVTKSGLMVGLGETLDEVTGALGDLRGVGVDIVTIGQYLRPSAAHLPVTRWWRPEEFDGLRSVAEAMGFASVVASPLTRSSYHAGEAAASAAGGG